MTDRLMRVMRVRWAEFAGWTSWIEAYSVEVDGPWLQILRVDGTWVFVPDHVVRGRVEVERIVDDTEASSETASGLGPSEDFVRLSQRERP